MSSHHTKRFIRPWGDMSKPLQAVISRENPDKVFDLIEKVGGGTYGDVFKVGTCYFVTVLMIRSQDQSLLFIHVEVSSQ